MSTKQQINNVVNQLNMWTLTRTLHITGNNYQLTFECK